MRFFVGVPHAHIAHRFDAAFISVHAIQGRKSAFPARDWIMDSGAFTTITKHGGYPEPVSAYAAQIRRWKDNGNLLAAVSVTAANANEAIRKADKLKDVKHYRVECVDCLGFSDE